jgi:hypothetical protein
MPFNQGLGPPFGFKGGPSRNQDDSDHEDQSPSGRCGTRRRSEEA